MGEPDDLPRRMRRLEELLHVLETAADPAVRASTREMVQTLLDFHAAGLARLLEQVDRAGESGQALRAAFARDGLIASLLLLHGLHPDDLEIRVRRALDSVRPFLRGHGADVILLAATEAEVRSAIDSNDHPRPPAVAMLKRTVEEAVVAAAPDTSRIVVEGADFDVSADGRFNLPLLNEPH